MKQVSLPSRSSDCCKNVFSFLKNAKYYAKNHDLSLIVAKKIENSKGSVCGSSFEFWCFQNMEAFSVFLRNTHSMERTFLFIMNSQSRHLYLDVDMKLDSQTYEFLVGDITMHVSDALKEINIEIEQLLKKRERIMVDSDFNSNFYVWNSSRKTCNGGKMSLHIVNPSIKFTEITDLKCFVCALKNISNVQKTTSKMILQAIDTAPYNRNNQFWRMPYCHNGEEYSHLYLLPLRSEQKACGFLQQLQLNSCDM